MAWKEVIVKNGKQDIPAFMRGNERWWQNL